MLLGSFLDTTPSAEITTGWMYCHLVELPDIIIIIINYILLLPYLGSEFYNFSYFQIPYINNNIISSEPSCVGFHP